MPAIVKFEKKGEIFWLAMRQYPQRPDAKEYRYIDLNGAMPAKRSQAPPHQFSSFPNIEKFGSISLLWPTTSTGRPERFF